MAFKDFDIPDSPDQLLRQMQQYIPKPQNWVPLVILAIIALALLSTFYTINTDEVGVIQRFGRYVRTTMPGLHWRLPLGIEKLSKVKVKRIYKEEFGFRTIRPGVKSTYSTKSYDDESLMLTGDLNVLDVTWIIQFRINDPRKILFNIRDPQKTVRDICESVMRQVIGDRSVSEVLTTSRFDINNEVQEKLQGILDNYESGVRIETVKLQDVNPPDAVKPSFNEVNEAKQEKEKVINQSWEGYNKIIPKARGEAKEAIQEAEGYALERINEAKGNAEKFESIWKDYKESKDVTRRRMYLETIQKTLPSVKRFYVVEPGGNPIVPLLQLQAEGTTP